MKNKQSENIWLGSFFAFLFLMILSTLFCAPCYCQIKVPADKFTASQGIATGTLTDGSKFVGAIDAGDYMDYSVNIPANGSYSIAFRVSSGAATTLQFKQGATLVTTIQIPNQFDYNKYVTMTTTVNLSFGQQTFRITTASCCFNVNYFTITPINVVPPVVIPPVVIPSTGSYTKAQTDSAIKANFNSLPDLILKKSGGAFDTLIFPFPGIKVYQLVKIYQ